MFACLDEPQMPFRQLQCAILIEHPEDRDVDTPKRVAEHRLVPVAADPVEDNACDPDIGAMIGITTDQCRDRMGEAGAIDDEDHGQPKCRGKIRRRPVPSAAPSKSPIIASTTSVEPSSVAAAALARSRSPASPRDRS